MLTELWGTYCSWLKFSFFSRSINSTITSLHHVCNLKKSRGPTLVSFPPLVPHIHSRLRSLPHEASPTRHIGAHGCRVISSSIYGQKGKATKAA